MKCKVLNLSSTRFRIYYVYKGKKFFKKNIKVNNGDSLEIHFDEMRNVNKLSLACCRLLMGLAGANPNSDEANQIVNNDVFIAKVDDVNNESIYTFSIDHDYKLTCDKQAMITYNDRKNRNERQSSFKAFLLIGLGFVFLGFVIWLSFFIAGKPF